MTARSLRLAGSAFLLAGSLGSNPPPRPLIYRPSSLAALADRAPARVSPSSRSRIVFSEAKGGGGRRVLIGGAIGAVAGVAVCTVISNIAKDPGTGFSTCTTKGYVGFAVGGFAVGAGLGAIVR